MILTPQDAFALNNAFYYKYRHPDPIPSSFELDHTTTNAEDILQDTHPKVLHVEEPSTLPTATATSSTAVQSTN